MEKIRLFCIPYAGGSSAIYYKWLKHLHEKIELYPVELAGRGKRFREPLYKNLNEAVEDVFCSINQKLDDSQYAIFGYSMGGLIAFELFHKINNMGCREPVHMFFSAVNAPHIKSGKNFHELTDSEFIKEIAGMGGTPDEIFKDRMLFDLYFPIIKSDFKIFDEYTFANKERLQCNTTVLYGKQDAFTMNGIDKWRDCIDGNCSIYGLDGTHFFIDTNKQALIEIINRELIQYLPGALNLK